MKVLRASFVFCFFSFLLACGAEGEVGAECQSIVSGELGGPAAAVSLNEQVEIICSAVLIAPDVALSAAHCLPLAAQMGVELVSGDPVELTLVSGDGEETSRVIESVPHPQFEPTTLLNDIGLLRLEEPMNLTVLTATACGSWVPERGQRLTVAGFGPDEDPHGPPPCGSALDDEQENDHAGHTHGDQRLRNTQMTIIDFNETQVVLEPSPGTTCVGDSGGPVYIEDPNCGTRLLGVVSAGSKDCLGVALFTRLDAFYDGFVIPAL